jgi:hypothetical protein
MKRLWGVVGLLLVLPLAAAAEVKYVQVEKARLLKKPSAFSATLATLPYRTSVEIISKQGAFYCVQAKAGKGYIAEASLTLKQPKFSSKLAGRYVSSEEVATATKGFNAQVESEYRQKNPELKYAVLDQIEAQTRYVNPQSEFFAFRKQGKLGEFQKGGE